MEGLEALHELQLVELPAVLAFRVAKTALALDPLVKSMNMARKGLFDKYGEKDSDGKVITEAREGGDVVKIADNEAFVKEMDLLMAAHNDIPLEAISISDLDGFNVKPMVFTNLMWLFQE